MPSHPAHDLLCRAHSPDTSDEIFSSYVKHRPLRLRPSSPDPKTPSNLRESRRLTRSKADIASRRATKRATKAGRDSITARTKPLNAKAKRRLQIHNIPRSERKWGLYIGLHQLWCNYIREVLSISEAQSQKKLSPEACGPLLASADYHGAILTVCRSGCISRVGLRGIVVKDTRHTFELVTPQDRLVTVPKEKTTFRFEVPLIDASDEQGEAKSLAFELHGENFRTSAPDRANKKFKLHIDQMSLTPSSLSTLPPHQSGLSALLHPKTGGIVDDTIITRLTKDRFYVVTNAGCRDKDYAFLIAALDSWTAAGKPTVTLTELKDQGLIALQGPLSAGILSSTLAEPSSLNLQSFLFGTSAYIRFALPSGSSDPCLASRGGYTGEDGFEISIPPAQTEAVTKLLLSSAGADKLRFAGLGARDSLRLEAGMCLYGHDLDDSTTPVEAGLSWIIGKSRREMGGFNGAETVLPQLIPASKGGAGVARRRVGFVVEGAPAREGAEIVDADGANVGVITSGCPSPTLGKNIAMGYIKNTLHKAGTEVQVVVRGKKRKAVVTKMPFVPAKYWKGGISPA